jgi:hypothetical protein
LSIWKLDAKLKVRTFGNPLERCDCSLAVGHDRGNAELGRRADYNRGSDLSAFTRGGQLIARIGLRAREQRTIVLDATKYIDREVRSANE